MVSFPRRLTMIFEDHNEAQAFIKRTKPPAGMEWGISQLGLEEGDEPTFAVQVTLTERWPIGRHPALDEPDKWTRESGDPLPK